MISEQFLTLRKTSKFLFLIYFFLLDILILIYLIFLFTNLLSTEVIEFPLLYSKYYFYSFTEVILILLYISVSSNLFINFSKFFPSFGASPENSLKASVILINKAVIISLF